MTVTEKVPPELVQEYDHLVCPAGADPFAILEGYRGNRAVWSPFHGGFWLITRAEDYREILHNHEVFKSESTIPPAPLDLIPMFTDPPAHTQYRQILTPLLSPHAVKRWEDFTREHARSRVEMVVDRGGCEFVSHFGRAIPIRVFALFMGLEASLVEQIDPIREESGHVAGSGAEAGMIALGAMLQAIGEIVDERMATPDAGDDVPRQLARARIDGRPLSREEILNILHTMFVAGFDTTSSMLTMCQLFLARHDDARRAVAEDPSRLPDAIEEMVRLHAFVQSSRRAVRDIDVAGVHIEAGDWLLLPTSLASRDPDEFEQPGEFDIDRFPNRHFGFGAGPHRCLGSHLARMELRVALEEWLRRIPEFRVPDGYTPQFQPGHVIGMHELLLEWDPATTR